MKGELPHKENPHLPQPESVDVSETNILVREKIVEFISELYSDKLIQSDGLVPKNTVRMKFKEFVSSSKYENCFPNTNIGTLLRDNKYLVDTPRGSNNYCISMKNGFDFCKENLNTFDNMCGSENSKKLNSYEIDEKEIIAEFILKLYHGLHLQPDGIVSKNTVRREFNVFVTANNKKEHFLKLNIGTLLWQNNCLYNTPRGSKDFRISLRRVFEIRNDKLKQLDEIRINDVPGNVCSSDLADKPLEASIEVPADAEEFHLVFQGGCKQQVDTKFTLLSLGCYICQKNFQTQSLLEDHISTHGFESDFEFLSTLKRMNNIFEIIYRLCNKSHYFNFTMKTKMKDVIIEKIIIVQTRLMHFVKEHLVPFELASDGMESFLVDSHLFTIGVEQPVVVVYRYKSDKTTRFVEQHHFLRIEDFPQVHFFIRSCRISDKTLMKTKNKLKDYFPDDKLKISQRDNFSDESLFNLSAFFRNYLESKILNHQNICNVLKTLIQIEDLNCKKDYYPLYQRAAQIKRFGREYSVKLRKLPKNIFLENIVSPLDEIILTTVDTKLERGNSNQQRTIKKGKKFVAIIERVYYDQVCFKYNDKSIDENEKYDIILRPSRLSLKYQYRALEMLSTNLKMQNYLFPLDGNLRKCLTTEKINLFDRAIQNNAEQLQAVQNIAIGPDVPAPFIIFGPPGTGKTSTLVETILQLWQHRPNSRILVTAGSNAACDEVALRLCRVLNQLQPEKPNIIRIFSKSNEKRLDSVEDILIEASNFYNGHFYPSVESIRDYRIIVCTLSIVGKLVSAAIGSEFFTHVFIDECGASTEPEVLVGLMGISSSKTRLILSGDHKQLGPVIKSTRAADLGLSRSLLERLLDSKCYGVDENGEYDRSIQTRLIRNYRSHPAIVHLYNRLYYDNQLKALAKKNDTEWALQWHLLPNRNYPVIFHSVYGSCRKNNNSVSLCNEQEISTVMDYVKDLLYFGIKGHKIAETDIGIISPYKKQYTRIQEELVRRRWNRIEVGSAETFQGKEKPIIIVSTVRSFTKTLGFLENPRRLNVIISRAKALLIIIGNPKTLSQNKDFKYIIDECVTNKCLVGGLRALVEEVPDGTTNYSLTGLDEANLNPNETHSKIKKHNFKAKKSSALKKKKIQAVTGKSNFETISSEILSPLKTEESKPKCVSSYLTLENLQPCGPRIDNIIEKTHNKNILTLLEEENMNKKLDLTSQNIKSTPIIKPQATVVPRRHAQDDLSVVPRNNQNQTGLWNHVPIRVRELPESVFKPQPQATVSPMRNVRNEFQINTRSPITKVPLITVREIHAANVSRQEHFPYQSQTQYANSIPVCPTKNTKSKNRSCTIA